LVNLLGQRQLTQDERRKLQDIVADEMGTLPREDYEQFQRLDDLIGLLADVSEWPED
jgi:hypothetical protein